jgi:outer membrane protein OmpA-like peptidoglycan-associated protein
LLQLPFWQSFCINSLKSEFKTTMLKKTFIYAAVLLFGCFQLNAQENLVQNPGFEEHDGKLKKLGQLDVASKWFSTTAAPSDLFSTDAKKEEIQIPENYQGTQKVMEGNSYAGAIFYSYRGKEARTYLTNELSQPLKKGQKYCVSYKVSLSKLSKYGVNNISAFLSKKDPSTKDDKTLMYPAQIKNKKNEVYNDQFEFQDVCNHFTATGGEKYLTIGNFEKDEDTEFEKMRRVKGITAAQTYNAYYYVDEVSVVAIDDVSECSCGPEEARPPKLVYSVATTLDENASLEQILASEAVYFDFISANLEPNFEQRLKTLAELISKRKDIKIELQGHIDATENEKASQQERYEGFGMNRAEAVRDYLIENGVPANQLTVKDVAFNDPAAKGGSDIAKAKCRRVTFLIK